MTKEENRPDYELTMCQGVSVVGILEKIDCVTML